MTPNQEYHLLRKTKYNIRICINNYIYFTNKINIFSNINDKNPEWSAVKYK